MSAFALGVNQPWCDMRLQTVEKLLDLTLLANINGMRPAERELT